MMSGDRSIQLSFREAELAAPQVPHKKSVAL
jgi:hypothetical protein